MVNVGDRIVVVRSPGEPEVIGMQGNAVIKSDGGEVTVFLDGDKFPSTFRENWLEVIPTPTPE